MNFGKLIGKGICKAIDGVQWLHEKGNDLNEATNKWEDNTHKALNNTIDDAISKVKEGKNK